MEGYSSHSKEYFEYPQKEFTIESNMNGVFLKSLTFQQSEL